MAERLILVDSPAQAEAMRAYFGADADCLICGWPLFKTSHQAVAGAPAGVAWQFDGLASGQECLTALQAFRDKEVILALDSNDRADYLCWQINGYFTQIGGRPERVKRLALNEVSRLGIEAALAAVEPVNDRQGLGYYSRLLFDDCLGRHLVRLLGTDRGPGNLALRQGSLTTLFLLAEREREQVLFVPAPKWQIQADLPVGEQMMTVCLSKGLEVPAHGLFRDEAKARAIKGKVERLSFVIDAVGRTALSIAPPEPYQLPELLHAALVTLGIDAVTTMAMVRKLHHGLPSASGAMGLITSPSPSTPPPLPETLAGLHRQVVLLHGESTLTDGPPPAAGMILPVCPELSGSDLRGQGWSAEEAALYDLIRGRSLAARMRPATGETITVDFRVGKENIFQAHFHELTEPGFLRQTPAEMARVQAPCPLANLEQGLSFTARQVRCQPMATDAQTAEGYTLDTLFATLADFAITPDPTTLAMLDELVKVRYASVSSQGTLAAAENTAKVVAILNRAFPRMQGVNLAAYIAQTIAEASTGRKDLPFALKQFDQTLMLHGKILVKAKITTKIQARQRTSSTIIKQTAPGTGAEPPPPSPCPEVEAPAATKVELAPTIVAQEEPLPQTPEPEPEPEPLAPCPDEGPTASAEEEVVPAVETLAADTTLEGAWPDDLKRLFAEALTAPASPATANDAQPDATPTPSAPDAAGEEGRRCPVCAKPMLLKEDSFGPYWGCSGFPGCRYSEAITQSDQALICPLCGQGLTRKQTPTGKNFYVCPDNDCQFMSWSKPHYLPCGLCDSPYLVEKSIHGVTQLRCPRAGCSYGQPLPGAAPAPTHAPTTTGGQPAVAHRAPAGATPSSPGTKKVRIVRRRA